ncbi:MAG: hypothetical protein WCT33_05140 [Patescibacteria group bacterium]
MMAKKKSKEIPVSDSNSNNAKKLNDKSDAKKDAVSEGLETITSIYRDDQTVKTDMTKLDQKKLTKKRLMGYFGIALLFMIAVASVAGFFIFNRGNNTGGKSIELSISAPKEISSGEEVLFEVTYLNKENVAINDADVTMMYPEGFHFSHSEPAAANEAHTFWQLKSIPGGMGGKIKIYGQVIGEIDETKTFQATMDYMPANFSSSFREKASHSLEITSSIFDLALKAPLRIVSGQETEIDITVKNNSEINLTNVRITAGYPEGFIINSSDPEMSEDKQSWFLKTLNASEEKIIKLKGVFTGNPGDTQELNIQLGIVMDNGVFRLQNEKTALVFIVKPELNLQFTVDGFNQEHSVNPDDMLEFNIAYQNASDLKLDNVVIQANFTADTQILNFAAMEDSRNGIFDEEQKTITWSATEMEELASIVPGATGNISVKIPVVSSLSPQKSSDSNFSVDAYAKVKSLEAEDTGNFEVQSESNHVIVKMNSKVELKAEARYYSDDFEKLGTGPIPPMVGEATTYRIFWTVSNLYNDLKNVEVTTLLPDDVSWNGNASGSADTKVTFNRETRTVTCKIQELPANSGTLLPIAKATFDVSITPTISQVGKLVMLTQGSILSARDTFTGLNVLVNDRVITTDLENDVAASGRGIVIEKLDVVNSNTNSTQ